MDEPAAGTPASRDPGVDRLDRWQAPEGTRFAIRPLRADDAAHELAFLDSLSVQTRYERTFSHRGLLTPGELRKLIRFDVREEIALVVTVPGATADIFVAVARLKRIPKSDRCEFAIVVGDRWQRRGVGIRLLGKLVEVSRRAGIAHIVGYTFSTNEAMKALARQAGFKVHSDPGDPSLAILEIDLRSGAQQ